MYFRITSGIGFWWYWLTQFLWNFCGWLILLSALKPSVYSSCLHDADKLKWKIVMWYRLHNNVVLFVFKNNSSLTELLYQDKRLNHYLTLSLARKSVFYVDMHVLVFLTTIKYVLNYACLPPLYMYRLCLMIVLFSCAHTQILLFECFTFLKMHERCSLLSLSKLIIF